MVLINQLNATCGAHSLATICAFVIVCAARVSGRAIDPPEHSARVQQNDQKRGAEGLSESDVRACLVRFDICVNCSRAECYIRVSRARNRRGPNPHVPFKLQPQRSTTVAHTSVSYPYIAAFGRPPHRRGVRSLIMRTPPTDSQREIEHIYTVYVSPATYECNISAATLSRLVHILLLFGEMSVYHMITTTIAVGAAARAQTARLCSAPTHHTAVPHMCSITCFVCVCPIVAPRADNRSRTEKPLAFAHTMRVHPHVCTHTCIIICGRRIYVCCAVIYRETSSARNGGNNDAHMSECDGEVCAPSRQQ